MITKIGVSSGEILILLEEVQRTLTVKEIEVYLGEDRDVILMSIGCLIREGLLEIKYTDGTSGYHLKKTTTNTERGNIMSEYYFHKNLDVNFEQAILRVTDALKKEGFGVLTEIDVQETLKKKLNVDFKRYKIFGACNPPLAYQALQAEENAGLMLPCNVVIKEGENGKTQILAIDPVASMKAIENPRLAAIAGKVKAKLNAVIKNL